MDFIWESITDWLKEILISGIVSNLSGMFDSTNEQVGNIVGQVGMTPQSWNSGIQFRDINYQLSDNEDKQAIILLVIAFLVSPMGLPMFAVWILSALQGISHFFKSI